MSVEVSVAIPVRNGGPALAGVLSALARQTVEHELLICDSGSADGSVELAERHGARILRIEPTSFSHGGTRNLLMEEASGSHVALLTQDSEPAEEHWLERMLSGFELADDIGIVYGPYRPRPQAPLEVRVELERWFASLSPDGGPRIDRLAASERSLPARALLGARGFFTDANACISRRAWGDAPFRQVAYAEDHVLAIDMLRAGWAKAYVPQAAVLHSHEYGAADQLRRCFDEWRGLLEVYGWREPADPRYLVRRLRGELGALRRELDCDGSSACRTTLMRATRHHVLRLAGAQLGSHADLLPASARRTLSLERRESFEPVDLQPHDATPEKKDFT